MRAQPMMWSNTLAVFLAIVNIDVGQAISLHKKDAAIGVALDLKRNHVSDPVARDLRRRSMTVLESLENQETLYYANVSLGTPAQTVRLSLDTGSSDLWCNTNSSTLCTGKGDNCASSGTYNANSSSTYQYLSSDFNITYVDGSGASGDYVTDTVSIGGATLKSFQFGIGYNSDSTVGVLGIGYPVNEAQVSRSGKSSYANLPKAMVDNGLIRSNAYSLWLNDLDANTGSILFGGVDSDKYIGDLQTLPIQRVFGEYAEFLITLTSVAYESGSTDKTYNTSDLPAAVLLDSGSSLTYLPDSIVEDIYNDLDVTYDTASGTGYVPCSYMNDDKNITFTFSKPTISVAMSEMVLVAGTGSTYSDGTPACVFGIAPAGSSTPVLGDTFLRSTYVVYDIANNEISLAQTNFNSTSQNIQEIGTGSSSSVPGATAVSNPVTSVVAAGTDATAVITRTGAVTSATGSSSAATTISGSIGMLVVMTVASVFLALCA